VSTLPELSKGKSGVLPAIVIPIMIAALLTVPVTTLYVFFRAYVMPTGSMEQTLLIGDHLVVRTRGIGPVHYPVDPRQVFIKRVSGVPGDRLKLVNKQLYLNGVAELERSLAWTAATLGLRRPPRDIRQTPLHLHVN
jgi:signal peptidase I